MSLLVDAQELPLFQKKVDLNPLQIANALKSLMQQFGLTQENIAQKIGKKRSTVANYLRLLSLSDPVQEAIANGTISMGHAKVLLSVENGERRQKLFERIVKEDLSVRETEEAANNIHVDFSPLKTRDAHLEALIEKLQELLGTKVTIQGNATRGRISIDYYHLEDLNRMIDLFKIEL